MQTRTAIALNERDREFLEVLTRRVRVLSLDQVARTFWVGTATAHALAEARLEQLAAAGLVERTVMMVHPELPLEAPLTTWQPDMPRPALPELSRRLRARWRMADVATPLFVATAAAAAQLGGHGGRAVRTSEATHDVHLAAVYLRMRSELPTRTRSWRSEAVLLAEGKGRREKLPDAMVTDGRSETAIEFGGSYAADKLSAFHAHCDRRRIGYEVW